jgi:hypothetical protein
MATSHSHEIARRDLTARKRGDMIGKPPEFIGWIKTKCVLAIVQNGIGRKVLPRARQLVFDVPAVNLREFITKNPPLARNAQKSGSGTPAKLFCAAPLSHGLALLVEAPPAEETTHGWDRWRLEGKFTKSWIKSITWRALSTGRQGGGRIENLPRR